MTENPSLSYSIFLAFSNFVEMHALMASYRIGVLTMKVSHGEGGCVLNGWGNGALMIPLLYFILYISPTLPSGVGVRGEKVRASGC